MQRGRKRKRKDRWGVFGARPFCAQGEGFDRGEQEITLNYDGVGVSLPAGLRYAFLRKSDGGTSRRSHGRAAQRCAVLSAVGNELPLAGLALVSTGRCC